MPKKNAKYTELCKTQGKKLADLLRAKGEDALWLSEELKRRGVGVERNTIYRYLNGETPMGEWLLDFSIIFGVHITHFFADYEPPKQKPVYLVVEKDGVQILRVRIEDDVSIRVEGE